MSNSPQLCPNCGTALIGEYCHSCGQRRLDGRLTVRAFVDDVARRVFRFDRTLAVTFWRMLREPGTLVGGYIEGRRGALLDPIHYFISSVFVQLVIATGTRVLAPLLHRESALSWLERLGGIVAVKILIIFWMASVWRLLFRQIRYNLAEIYVFATYVFGTAGLLWAFVPIIDLLVPWSLGGSASAVVGVALGIELVYTSYAVRQFSGLPLWKSVLRVGAVLAVGYGLLVVLLGVDGAIGVLLPPMPV